MVVEAVRFVWPIAAPLYVLRNLGVVPSAGAPERVSDVLYCHQKRHPMMSAMLVAMLKGMVVGMLEGMNQLGQLVKERLCRFPEIRDTMWIVLLEFAQNPG